MEEQNNQNFENHESKGETKITNNQKQIPNIAIIIGAAVAVIVVIAIVIIALLGGNKNGPSNPNDNPTHTHAFDEWETIKNATCTVEGTKERYCACGEKQTSTISMTEHTYGEWEIVKEATYTEKGSESRKCTCGKTETRDIAKKDEPVTTSLTKNEYLTEIEMLFNNVVNQKTLWFNDHNATYARYFDGTEFFCYSRMGKDEDGWSEGYMGKVGDRYLMLNESTDSFGNKTKNLQEYSKSDLEYFVEFINEVLYEDVWDYASLENDSDDGFKCSKTVSDKIVYIISGVNGSTTTNVTVTVFNNLITEISNESITVYNNQSYTDKSIITLFYDKEIIMPDINEYS